MSNSVFPVLPGLSWDVTKRPVWRTHIQSAVSGKELRAAYMSYPLWQFGLSYEVLRADAAHAELQQIVGFFNARNGSYDSFLYTDPTDSTTTAEAFGTGNGAATQFQLTRALGGFVDPIQNINGTPVIQVAGVTKTAGTDYTIGSTGLVTFAVAPANGAVLTWTGNYYWRVRFMQDVAEFSNFMHNLWALKKLEFQSVKL